MNNLLQQILCDSILEFSTITENILYGGRSEF